MLEHTWSWVGLLGLGAFHGLNPGMGWLFAVALGMQERRSSAVWQALLPLTLGHALAVAVVIVLALAAGVAIPPGILKWPIGAALIGLGVYRLWRHRHPRGGGMRVGLRGLTSWSFLMASCHGAGLMVLPIVMGMTATPAASCHLAAHGATAGVAATAVHGAGYLLVTGFAALVVFRKFGLGLLRRAWFNVDVIWAAALAGTGALTLGA